MLPANHPSSFCHLLGLDTEELHHVIEASGFIVECGNNNNIHFQYEVFKSFLSCYPELQPIDDSLSKPSAIKPCKECWSYLIGQPNGDS
jgi:hypothetical protein